MSKTFRDWNADPPRLPPPSVNGFVSADRVAHFVCKTVREGLDLRLIYLSYKGERGHLFGPLAPEMRNDTAFMNRIHACLFGWDIPKVSKTLFTDSFGLVSDVLAECFSRLGARSRAGVLQRRGHFGGSPSGRDQNAVNKTVSGLLKLLYSDPAQLVYEANLEWAVRLGLEARQRVKEQQKRIGSAEFRNTQFSYVMGLDGLEKLVATPKLQTEDSIGSGPLPVGQVWAISPGGQDEPIGLFRIEVTESSGSGVRILNLSPPIPFLESVKIAEQNLYSRATELVGDRNPREHGFAVQLRSFDAAKTGDHLRIGVLVALASAFLDEALRGGLTIVGDANFGGSIDSIQFHRRGGTGAGERRHRSLDASVLRPTTGRPIGRCGDQNPGVLLRGCSGRVAQGSACYDA